MTIYEVINSALEHEKNRFNILYLTAILSNLTIEEACQPAALLGVLC